MKRSSEIIFAIMYLVLFCVLFFNGRELDQNFKNESYKTSLIRRSFYMSFWFLLFSSIFFIYPNEQIYWITISFGILAAMGTFAKYTKSENKIDDLPNFCSVLIHFAWIYPIIIYSYFSTDLDLTCVNYLTVFFISIILPLYITAHPFIYERPLFKY